MSVQNADYRLLQTMQSERDKQSYINYRNGSLHQISTNSGKPTFDIFSFITSGPTDRLCKLNDL